MRFKDFVIKKAIKEAYDIYINQMDSTLLGQIYIKLGSKFGYKMVNEKVITNVKPTSSNKEFLNMCERYETAYSTNHLRYLNYDIDTKKTLYFDEVGNLYEYNYKKYNDVNKGYEILNKEEYKEFYDKNKEFLDFAVKYFNEIQKTKIQYLLLGYDNKHCYYVGSDGKGYYTSSPESTNYLICTPRLLENMKQIIKENMG